MFGEQLELFEEEERENELESRGKHHEHVEDGVQETKQDLGRDHEEDGYYL